MNLDEALLKYGCSDREELADLAENQLFELKQELLMKPLLYKTFQPKQRKLDELASIFELLKNEIEPIEFNFPVQSSSSYTALIWWKEYSAYKAFWKFTVGNCTHPVQLNKFVNESFSEERNWVSVVPAMDWSSDTPIFGVDPDPMMVQKELNKASENQWDTFTEIHQNKKHVSNELLLALKRLSLLPNYLQA